MKTKSKKVNSMQGFTIIEVVLVLAIAGLIMLMVFLALPAMQRGQRDRQRSQDISRLYTALQNYGNNNKGALPQPKSTTNTIKTTATVDGNNLDASTNDENWKKFYTNYLTVGGDTFEDPAGGPYSLNIVTCSSSGKMSQPNAALTAGDACSKTLSVGEGDKAKDTFKDGEYTNDLTFESQGDTILIIIGGKCQGEKATAATTKTGGARKFALMYKNEGGGVTCQSN